jgi:hypothetical protein
MLSRMFYRMLMLIQAEHSQFRTGLDANLQLALLDHSDQVL